ncbi:MAG: hypothetical protein PF636_08715 [Actinomycetota bacterium]|jgi:hypothetical protein|nr:hypothetical protein [Actinomycetota bacterium]
MLDAVATSVTAGLELAIRFNPVFAVVGATVAAALSGRKNALHEHRFWAGSILVGAWLIGDGMRVIARSRDVYDGVARLDPSLPVWADWTTIALWAVLGLTIGYGLPAWAGAFAGRRVTHGTGWMTAAAIAVGTALAISSLAAYIA